MPTLPEDKTLNMLVEVATLNNVEAVEEPMTTLPVLRILILSVAAVVRMISPVEEAVKVLAEDMTVELADWMVKVEAVPVVFQKEAAAPVRFKAPAEVMSVEFKVRVVPMVAVAAYMFPHLAEAEPKLYILVVLGSKSPVMVVVEKEVVPLTANVPPKMALPEP